MSRSVSTRPAWSILSNAHQSERALKNSCSQSALSVLCIQSAFLSIHHALTLREYPTQADRKAAQSLNPYACWYQPWQIRDFALDEFSRLEWVLLDDSRIEKASPLAGP